MSLDVKICGLRSEEAIDAAVSGGASHVGFIFFPRSPRNVEPAEAGRLRLLAAEGGVKAVAVTVDAGDAALDAIVEAVRPDLLQLHGKETPGRAAEIKVRYGLPVMKALSIGEAADLRRIEPYIAVADRFLLDARPPAGSELPGGNGVSFDWSLLAQIAPDVDYMLSGGIDAGNVKDALKAARPAGIDVSSGVEKAPGVKDPALIARFLESIRDAREPA